MNLRDLLNQHSVEVEHGVPEWMLGCFRRRCISFANGESDTTTNVFWLQSHNFTIDLRLPRGAEQVPAKGFTDYTAAELQTLANYEGWVADSVWDGNLLSWQGGTSLQAHNRWPEPAELRRIGNCMMEFAPSGAYVEDWRLQASTPGPLVGLCLRNERNPATGEAWRRNGGLIICGEHAALVLGRRHELAPNRGTFPEKVAKAAGDAAALAELFDFETSLAQGSVDDGFIVSHSTQPGRAGQPLLDLAGFEWLGDNCISHTACEAGTVTERIFSVDAFEPLHDFSQATPCSDASAEWFKREAATLARYTQTLF